jgi:hypothetical protein
MQFLASGFEYKVYDLGSGRVLKKAHPYLHTFFKVVEIARRREKISFLKAMAIAYRSGKNNKKSLETMKKKMNSLPQYLFANPKFVGNTLNFTQDKVVPLEKYLIENSLQNNKEVILKYTELQKVFWSYGIHDAVYKFQPNYGVDNEGRVVCIDFGEFVFTCEEAIKSINKKKWLSRPSYKKWEEGELKNYYTALMGEVMIEEELKKYWGKEAVVYTPSLK